MKVLIAGGSGLIGRALTKWLLKENIEVVWLSQTDPADKPCPVFRWNTSAGYTDPKSFEGVDVVINLSGAGIADSRWTKKRKQIILQSRLDAINTLGNYLSNNKHGVKKIINASAIGIYGNNPRFNLTETDTTNGKDFLSDTVRKWELAAGQFAQIGIPLVLLRTGIVLSRHGGAMKQFLKPFCFGTGVVFGHGQMHTSWIHIDDLCQMFVFILKNNLEGVFNAVAPNPVTNVEFIKAISRIKEPFVTIKIPLFVLRLMFGELASMLLCSQHISTEKIKRAGFQFRYNYIDEAMHNLLTN